MKDFTNKCRTSLVPHWGPLSLISLQPLLLGPFYQVLLNGALPLTCMCFGSPPLCLGILLLLQLGHLCTLALMLVQPRNITELIPWATLCQVGSGVEKVFIDLFRNFAGFLYSWQLAPPSSLPWLSLLWDIFLPSFSSCKFVFPAPDFLRSQARETISKVAYRKVRSVRRAAQTVTKAEWKGQMQESQGQCGPEELQIFPSW